MILGSGHNACYLEKVSNVDKWRGEHEEKEVNQRKKLSEVSSLLKSLDCMVARHYTSLPKRQKLKTFVKT